MQLFDENFALIQNTPEISNDYESAKNDVLDTGEHFYSVVSVFLNDPTNGEAQDEVYHVFQALMSSLSRILILTNVVDIFILNQLFDAVLNGVVSLQNVTVYKLSYLFL